MMRALTMEGERAQLDLAFDPRRMGPVLAQAFGVHGARAGGGGCHILDAKYAPRERCIVLYELGQELILGQLCWDGAIGHGGTHIPEAGMRAYRFPDDPALPGLPAALDPRAAARVLGEVLGERVVRCSVTLLRYRPTRRATLRLDLRTPARTRRTLFVKVYHDLRKAVGVESTLRALAGTPAVRAGRLVIPQPVAAVDALRWVLFEPVAGARLDGMLSRGGQATEALTAAAGALAALHHAGPLTGRPRPVTAQLARVTRRAERTIEVAPTLGAAMAELAAELAGRLPRQDETTLVHGDCKPSQFLISSPAPPAPQVALLDFDSCGIADPVSDVAAFLAGLRKLGVGHPLAPLGGDFLDAYCAAAGCGADLRARVPWYQALALLRKAQRAFARAPRSPLPATILAAACACLTRGVE